MQRYNKVHARLHDVEFEPVGWEDTLPDMGRPQAKINEDLERCDYAIFAFHDRWGSKTGNGDLVGTEEEWKIAERLYGAEGGYQIRQMALYFKAVPQAQAKDPGEEFRNVLAFKAKVFADKQHLCGAFDSVEVFAEKVEEHLAAWLAKHLKPVDGSALAGLSAASDGAATLPPLTFTPDFAFWMGEAKKALFDGSPDYAVSLSHVAKALPLANDDEQRAEALLYKGFTLGALDRSAEAIAVYDDLIARFGNSDAAALQEQVANALLNKACTWAKQGRVSACTDALDRWAEKRGGFDCDAIANDRDFDAIREQPKFLKYLEKKGCTG